MSKKQFKNEFFGEERESTGTVERWFNGEQIVSPISLNKLRSLSELAYSVYNMPVFELLEPMITSGKIMQLMKNHTTDNPFRRWSFEVSDPFALSPKDKSRLILVGDSDGLFQMGGVYGFTGILMLLRKAELDKDATRHFLLLQNAYKAFPGFCRNRYFKRHWKEFLETLISIHANIQTSSMLIRPRIGIIRQQIHAKEHITERSLRPRSPTDGNFTELEKPFVLAQFPN